MSRGTINTVPCIRDARLACDCSSMLQMAAQADAVVVRPAVIVGIDFGTTFSGLVPGLAALYNFFCRGSVTEDFTCIFDDDNQALGSKIIYFHV